MVEVQLKEKSRYLLLSFLLWIPPIHELGHVIICWIFNVQVVEIQLAKMSYAPCNDPLFCLCHIIWDWGITPFVPFISFLIYEVKYYKKNNIKQNPKGRIIYEKTRNRDYV